MDLIRTGGAAALGLVLGLAACLLLGRRAAPRRGFGGPDDRPVHAGCGFVGEHHLGVDEPGSGEAVEVLRPGQGAGHAPDVGAPLGAIGWGEVVLGNDARDPDPTTQCEHTKIFRRAPRVRR